MCAADEVFEMNTLYGTCIVASATTCTLIIVNNSKIILNCNCAMRTGLLTLHTADTAVGACLTCNSALVMAGALNNDSAGLGEHVDNALRTGLSTEAATDTSNGINLGNAVLGIDVNSVLGTNLHTVAVTKTSEGTLGVTGEGKLNCLTGLNSVVNVLSVLCLALTVTTNEGNLLNNVACSETHNLCNLSSYVSTTGSTEAGVIGLALGESSGIAVTTGEATSTAVRTGKAITNCSSTLIHLNSEEAGSKGKNDCTNKCNDYENY